MTQNYTPLDLKKINQGEKITFYLLIAATIMSAILAILLFLLIQKKIREEITSTIPSPTHLLNPTVTVTPFFKISSNEATASTPVSSPAGE